MNIIGKTNNISGIPRIKYEDAKPSDVRCFVASTDKDSLSYTVGEDITFDIALTVNDELAYCHAFEWTIKGDDGQSSSGTVSGKSGTLTLKTRLSEPGFVMVVVKAMNEEGTEINEYIRYSGAAGANIRQLERYAQEPYDFDEYWAHALEELGKVAPDIIEMQEITAKSGFKAYKMKIAAPGDDSYTGHTYTSGYLTYPENAAAGSLRLKACFQGYGVVSPELLYEEGYAFFSVCAHSMEIGREASYYDELSSGGLESFGMSDTINANPEKVYFRYMILRDLQAIKFMREYFGKSGNGLWDGNTITLNGTSQGGFQAIALAALDGGINSIDVIVPWLCDIGGQDNGKRIGSALRPALSQGMRYFDSTSFAKRINCPVTVIGGLGDAVCPPAGIMALYNAFHDNVTLTFLQNRTHGYVPPKGDKFTFTK